MSQPIEAAAVEEAPASARTAGWKLVEETPTPDLPVARSRAGAQRGMVLVLLGGGIFWGGVAAAIWFATR